MPRKSHFEQLTASIPFTAPFQGLDASLKCHEWLPLRANTLDTYVDLIKGDFPPSFQNGPPMLRPLRAMLFLKLFERQGAPLFYMAHDFAHELLRVNLDIPASHLPGDGQVVSVELPDDLGLAMAGKPIRSFYIVATEMENRPDSHGPVFRRVEIQFQLQDNQHEYKRVALHFYSPQNNVTEAIAQALKTTNEDFPPEVIQYAINCLLYIRSGSPDLRAYRPERRPANRRTKIQRIFERRQLEQSMLPATLVGFDFKKPRIYSVGEVPVTGHFQWYRVGEGRTELRLNWKQPHVRHLGQENEL